MRTLLTGIWKFFWGLPLLLLLLTAGVFSPASAKVVGLGANPLGLAIGVFNVHLDLGLGEKFTIGAEYQVYKDDQDLLFTNWEDKSTGYGVRLRYFANKVFEDSWVVTGMGGKIDFDTTITVNNALLGGGANTTSTISGDGTYFGLMLGYQWQWSLLYLHLGFGYMLISAEYDGQATLNGTPVEPSIDGGTPLIDFSIGMAF